MTDPISSIRAVAPVTPSAPQAAGAAQDGSFEQLLHQALDRVEGLKGESKDLVNRFLAGEQVELHDVALANERAGLAFELMQQVRNKLVSAYQEVMRTQL